MWAELIAAIAVPVVGLPVFPAVPIKYGISPVQEAMLYCMGNDPALALLGKISGYDVDSAVWLVNAAMAAWPKVNDET